MERNDINDGLRAVRQEITRHGGQILGEDHAVLAYIVAETEEGHFRVDPQPDGSWTIWSTGQDDPVVLSGSVSPNVLAATAGECFLEAASAYCAAMGQPAPLPVPPPWVRARDKNHLAEEAVAQMVEGTLAPTGMKGYDVTGPDGCRYQVKSSVRNPKSGLISTLKFSTDPGYHEHDRLIYVEFTTANYPVQGWMIESDAFRSAVPPDRRSHQVEALLREQGEDITAPLRSAFDARFMP